MTDTVVAEGQVKFKDGKKWKSRWVVLRKPSPVADCLSLLVYRDRGEKSKGHRERLHLTLEGVCGLEPGLGLDGGVAYTLTLLCPGHSVALGFDTRDGLQAWDARLRYSLGEVHRFSVGVQPGTKLESGPASLHLCNDLLVLTRDHPPAVIGRWKLSDLRRYGAVPSGFVFEGGTRCGYWAGVFFLSCAEGEQISFLFDCIVRGLSPSRAPHGLRPALPDPSANPSLSEERINHEASELERRLSMLSQSSRQSSTASTYSFSTSVAGDDGSSISSSSSSQSDASYGSRLPSWAEPTPRSHPSSESLSVPPTTKTSTNPDDSLYAAVMGGSVIRPSSKQTRPRGLHDSGRQSSLDSGIGIATGSQSSYSGSFSSCTGSLDTASQGGGEEFGSQLSLPPPQPPPPLPPPAPPSLFINTPDHSPAAPLPCLCPARTDASPSAAPWRAGEEYQVPSRLRYDTPRNLLQSLAPKDPLAQGGAPESDRRAGGGGGQGLGLSGSPLDHWVGPLARSLSQGSEREAPPADGTERCSSSARTGPSRPPTLLPGCPVCGGTQCDHCLNYITHEQWYSAKKRGCPQGTSPSGFRPASSATDKPPVWREEGGGARAGGDRGEPTPSSFLGPPQTPVSSPGRPVLHRQISDSRSTWDLTESPRRGELRPEEYGSVFTFPPGAPSPSASPFLDARPRSDSSANYVNIPVSLAAKASAGRELLYMELDLQEPAGPAPVSSPLPPARGGGSTRYAHIDIAATETAQRVGAEHAQGRQHRLEELEQRRRAAQN